MIRAHDPNLPYLRCIAEALGDLREQVVFVGGAVAVLLITDPLAMAFAPLLADPDFVNVLPGLISAPERAELIMERMRTMSR